LSVSAGSDLGHHCVVKPPKSVLQHSEADTMLLCSRARLNDYEPHWRKFGSVITFEEIAERFPGL
jgi:hypothetical protein